MPYPEWLVNSTLGTMAGVGGGFPPNAPTIATIGEAPPGDPFDIRYGAWERTRSPGGLPAYRPEQTAPVPPPQMMPPRDEELLQQPAPGATMLAQAEQRPFWQRLLGGLAGSPFKPAQVAALPTPQFGPAPRFSALGKAGRNVRNIYARPTDYG